jgi:hypothetical protein
MNDEPVTAESDERFDWATRETLLDVTVNAIPMAILLFFVVLYTVIRPWEFDPAMFVLMHFLTLFPLVVLVLLTYVSAKVITRDERHV